jgi:hypothetical protein
MLDRQVLITVEKLAWDMLFLPQEMVWHEVWTRGLQRRNNYKKQYPRREM